MPTLRTRAGKGSALTHNELDANFKRSISQKTTTYSCVVGDNRSVIECNSATPFTVTLGDAATMDNAETGDYEVTIGNIGSGDVTIARAGSDTIDNGTSLTLNQYDYVTLKVNSSGNGYNTIGRRIGTANSDDLDILAGASAAGVTAAEFLYINGLTSAAQTQITTNLALIGLHYLDVKTASSSSSLDFTSSIDSTYSAYLFWIQNLVPATDATDLYFRVSTDGGSTYVASANAYYYNAAIGATYFLLASPVSNTANRGGVSGYVILYNPSSSSIKKQIHGNNIIYASSAGANTYATDNTRGVYDATTAVNAVRFIQSSGTLASGKIIMYGLKG